MNRHWIRGFALAAVLALTGCASSNGRDTAVTRFHLGTGLEPGPVSIQPATGDKADSLEYTQYEDIVEGELRRAGFDIVTDADLQAQIEVTRGLQQQAPKRSPFSIGIGGGSFGGNVGVGGSVNVPVGGSSGGEVFVTTLAVTLIRASENAVAWEGTATRSDAAGPTSPLATMQAMARALFQDFPGESGKTISVSDPVSE